MVTANVTITVDVYWLTYLSLLNKKKINTRSCQIHLLMFCRAWLGHWQHFPVTGDTQHSVCVSRFTWADIISFNRNSVWTFAHSNRAESIKNIGNLVGRQLSLSGRGWLFYPSESMNTPLTEQSKIIWHLTVQDTRGEICVGAHAYASTNTQGQSGYFFSRLAENGICRRGKLKPKKNLRWEHRLSIMKR